MQEKEREQTQSKSASQLFNRLFFSRMLEEKNAAKKIAFIALMTAFCVVANMLEIKLGGVQFSLTIFISGLTGMVIGGGAGFCACFLGDLIGFSCIRLGNTLRLSVYPRR
jgi:ABC-type Co2+ transport system permease subunit